MYKEIKLRGKNSNVVVKVDEEDFDFLNSFKWYGMQSGKHMYAITLKHSAPRKTIFMHSLILDIVDDPTVKGDHINRNTLDNRKENLRTCTQSENNRNQDVAKKRVDTASKYKGVIWHKQNRQWQAGLFFNKNYYYLGHYVDEQTAALAYDKAVLYFCKEFAVTNFPAETPKEQIRVPHLDFLPPAKKCKFKGVSFIKSTGKYHAKIVVNRYPFFLGSFDNEIVAAQKYDVAALLIRGEGVTLNFPPPNYISNRQKRVGVN